MGSEVCRTLWLVALCGCWTAAPPTVPPPQPITTLGRVAPPTVDAARSFTPRPAVVELDGRLYVVELRGRAIEVRSSAPRLEPSDLGKAPHRDGAVLVAFAPNTPFARVARIADHLARAGRCMIPVVQGPTGFGTLASDRCPAALDPDRDEPTVELTLYITPKIFWVGLSRINEFQEVRREGLEPKGPEFLARVVTLHKRSAVFAGRDTLELTADGRIAYSEVIAAGAIAAAAGWDLLRIVAKDRASAIPQLQ